MLILKFSAISPKFLLINQQRNFATLKDISLRLKSIKNIQKITKSMKMVSAAKYAKAERELKGGRIYGIGSQKIFENILHSKEASELTKGESDNKKRLLVLMTSDRGLCGSVHTSICKEAKHILSNKPNDVEYKLVLIGDKAKSAFSRNYSNDILLSGNEIGRQPPTFRDASTVATAIIESGYHFDEGWVIYNNFKSVVSYRTTKMQLSTLDLIKSSPSIGSYDSLDDTVVVNFAEYSLAQTLYYAMKESSTSEQSSRMTAMDSASKNAGEMIDKLTMAFNRTRQAVITRELIEIISGAACV
ncbi:unnamed protein product [Dracunculus medinensis]|uniref:ATP synthase subunit gamma n=1 Tax=Dracunculus medinensis TaxID=318479 RepID=A0A0N4UK18_DRAME|nr:unnamed protein product [Dracunculus medinensis]